MAIPTTLSGVGVPLPGIRERMPGYESTSVVAATKDNVADVAIWYRHDGAKRNLGVYAARGG